MTIPGYSEMEPGAQQIDFEQSPLVSLAISAKRIADALESIDRKMPVPDSKRDEAETRRNFIGIGSGN